MRYEQDRLRAAGRQDWADAVRHVAELEGDGAGYDVASFDSDGNERFIEVKTTRDGPETDFFISSNEVEFSRRQPNQYTLFRVYGFDPDTGLGKFFVRHGALTEGAGIALRPTQFRVTFVAND